MKVFAKTYHSISGETFLLVFATLILLVLGIVSLSIGRYPISIPDILKCFFSPVSISDTISTVIYNVRMPRIVGAILVGGALAIAGASYQGMFRNPMVSPDILGVTSGAGFGAALGILLSFPIVGVQIMSFGFGLIAVFLSFSISRVMDKHHDKILMLVLSGMVIATLFGSFISLMKYVADPDSKLPAITYWLMGSLANLNGSDLKTVAPMVIVGVIPLILVSWKLNVLSFGEEEAKALGLNTDRLRFTVVVCASLITASVVSVTGIIGWIGLIIPHFARLLIGPNHKVMLPLSFIIGAIFLLLVDNVARTFTSLEIPLGILTAIIGAPFFLFFLYKTSKKSW
jgi:iron complex transport system permease protein